MNLDVKNFFHLCHSLDELVLRPLSHLDQSWELLRSPTGYVVEKGHLSEKLIELIDILATTTPPLKYHDNEDRLAEYLISKGSKIRKEGRFWIGADYEFVLQQASLAHTINHTELVHAASGRVIAALNYGQRNFDDMEEGHKKMLASILTILIFNYGTWMDSTEKN
ncbi:MULTISPECIES: hypothetical protein [Pseudomonas]|uniref:hypothetical protein n=1 Tax=Pseudomonas TaxID=286 RepID=UPI00076148D2|nr:hypothetical protein [Pseudomonas monteilii]